MHDTLREPNKRRCAIDQPLGPVANRSAEEEKAAVPEISGTRVLLYDREARWLLKKD